MIELKTHVATGKVDELMKKVFLHQLPFCELILTDERLTVNFHFSPAKAYLPPIEAYSADVIICCYPAQLLPVLRKKACFSDHNGPICAGPVGDVEGTKILVWKEEK